ncbi:shikimate dehydrogenase [Hylemonella gracilis]|jgi:shikimate dehydrogenase|nr:shikimate dehydrogenase [Hylemonella gracilis]
MNMETHYTLAGIMGWPVRHSRSPVIHGHWIREHGLQGNYVMLPVQPTQLPDALRGLKALGFAGCNLTIPHKVAALALLDRVDPLAARIGAVNTLVVQDGQLVGYNTDAEGYTQSLREAQPAWRADAGPHAGPVTVLGAGGAARAVLAVLGEQGAPEIRVCNRSRDKAEALVAEFSAHYPGTRWLTLPWDQRDAALEGCAQLVNTTSLGMTGQDALDLRLDALPHKALVCDVIYTPLETPLLAAARLRPGGSHVTVNGLGMLLHQARAAFQHWFGLLPEITPALRRSVEATF